MQNFVKDLIFLQITLLFVASVLPEPDGLAQNYIRFFINFCCGTLHLEKF